MPKPRACAPEGMRRCSTCKEVFPETEEFFGPSRMCRKGLVNRCRICTQNHVKRQRRVTWAGRLSTYVRGRHTTKKYPGDCDITKEYLEQMFKHQKRRCYWTGVLMVTDMDAPDRLRLITLDRLDCSQGYIRGNIVLSSKAANQARGNASVAAFKDFLQEIR